MKFSAEMHGDTLCLPQLDLEYRILSHRLSNEWREQVCQKIRDGNRFIIKRAVDSEMLQHTLALEIYQAYQAILDAGLIDLQPVAGPDSFFNQETLNKIHQHVQSYEEKRFHERTEHEKTLELLHQKLHTLEIQLRKEKAHTGAEKNELILYLELENNDFELKLNECDYENFLIPGYDGDLYLGYSTVGKNLWNVYQDQDVDLIRQQKVKPQLTYRSQLLACHRESQVVVQREIMRQKQKASFIEWCTKHETTADGYDPNHRIHTPGLALLGQCTRRPTLENLRKILHSHAVIL